MTVADEPQYFEASLSLTDTGETAEVSAYSTTNTIYLQALDAPTLILTSKQARKLGQYLIKASKKAKCR